MGQLLFSNITSKGNNTMKTRSKRFLMVVSAAFAALIFISTIDAQTSKQPGTTVTFNTIKIDGLDIFYREAGDRSKPTILLLHGFPTSSFMFRNLIPQLADDFHLVAPDYPGFGQSSAPDVKQFNYTFDNLANVIDKFTLAVGLKRYAIYVQDYGSPVGFRLAVKNPEKISAIIEQNGNAYLEGLSEAAAPLRLYGETLDPKIAETLRGFLKPETTKFQYTHGAKNLNRVSPDTWMASPNFRETSVLRVFVVSARPCSFSGTRHSPRRPDGSSCAGSSART